MVANYFIASDYISEVFIDDALKRLAISTELFLKLLYENVAKSHIEDLTLHYKFKKNKKEIEDNIEAIIKKYNLESLITSEIQKDIVDILINKEKFKNIKQKPTARPYFIFWLLPIFTLKDTDCKSYIEPIMKAYNTNSSLIKHIENIIKLRNNYSHPERSSDTISKRKDVRDWLFMLMSLFFSISKFYEKTETYY